MTFDCRSGQPAPMSEAFLQMAGGGVQSVGAVHDKNACAVWYGECSGQGEADWEAADNRPGFTSHIFEALPSVSKGAVECFGIS